MKSKKIYTSNKYMQKFVCISHAIHFTQIQSYYDNINVDIITHNNPTYNGKLHTQIIAMFIKNHYCNAKCCFITKL